MEFIIIFKKRKRKKYEKLIAICKEIGIYSDLPNEMFYISIQVEKIRPYEDGGFKLWGDFWITLLRAVKLSEMYLELRSVNNEDVNEIFNSIKNRYVPTSKHPPVKYL